MENTLINIEEKIKKDSGCLCYVWNEEVKNPFKKLIIIRSINKVNYPFIFNDGWSCVHYKNAEPVSMDIIKFIIKGL